MLRKNRDERYQTMKDVLTALKELDVDAELKRSLPGDATGRTMPLPAARPASSAEYLLGEIKRHKRVALLAIASLSVVAVGIAYMAPWIYQRPKTY